MGSLIGKCRSVIAGAKESLPPRGLFSRLDSTLRIRSPLSIFSRILLGVIPVLAIFALWNWLTLGEAEERIISPTILPSPAEVISQFGSLWFDKELSRSAIASLQRVIGGFVVGLLVALPLGILMGSFTLVRGLLEPIAVFGAYLPIPALVPLTLSLFGIGEGQKIMFLALAFFVYLLPLFARAVDDVDNVYLQTAYTLGASKWQVVRKVLIRISAPDIFHAMRLGFGVGWTYIILAEMVAAERGLGSIIIVAQRRGPREHIYLVLVVIVLIAYLTDKLWEQAGKKLFPYKEAK